MCYAVPAKILNIEGDDAKVDYGGVIKQINIKLVDRVKIGDYVLIHAGFAIEKVEKKSAVDSLNLIKKMIAEK